MSMTQLSQSIFYLMISADIPSSMVHIQHCMHRVVSLCMVHSQCGITVMFYGLHYIVV
ncbi:uncharacterized protein BDW47DRAFT_101977 [Aspergillus candidus]|uniref:Uncharacterized protein n=1 Tax=Aspergillus candidus TaxID=41067 RepID=A0A2I2FH36_ASPCN|nr:hypothetical protein BDW47DRAFT_101977 [Aspergillus candidus]PLB39946.1 hypothetical protein BDW47DRAFT_101977 [Aspergillus candidus]